jgi:hypothetical protein
MIGLFKFFIFLVSSSLAVLDPARNVLREAPVETKYFYSIILSLFWCLAFGLYVGEFLTIGYNMVGHVALISMAFLTWAVFRSVERANQSSRDAYEALRSPDRTPKCYDMTDEERRVAAAKIITPPISK